MIKFNFAAAMMAISLFSFAQFSGWNLFDNEASASQGQRLHGSGGSGRTFHK